MRQASRKVYNNHDNYNDDNDCSRNYYHNAVNDDDNYVNDDDGAGGDSRASSTGIARYDAASEATQAYRLMMRWTVVSGTLQARWINGNK